MEKKKKYSWNKTTNVHKRNEELNDTLIGFLIFTDKNKEKRAKNDAFDILNENLDELYPSLSNQTTNLIDLNKTSKIDQEIQQLQKKKKFFFPFETHCSGVVFIKVAKEIKDYISVKEISLNIMNKVNERKEIISKNISKFIPIEIAFRAKYEIFKDKIKELIDKNFQLNDKDEGKHSWKVEIRVRNNNSINKNDYMNYVTSLIDKEHYYVDYKNPEKTVFIDITNNLCCISVLEKYEEYKVYNLQSLAKTEEEREFERTKKIEIQKQSEQQKLSKEKGTETENVLIKNKEENDSYSEEIDIL